MLFHLSVYYTDHVICTLPLGWLKTKKVLSAEEILVPIAIVLKFCQLFLFKDLFVPELPKDKQDAMEKLSFGTVDKIFLEYDRPFLAPILTEGEIHTP